MNFHFLCFKILSELKLTRDESFSDDESFFVKLLKSFDWSDSKIFNFDQSSTRFENEWFSNSSAGFEIIGFDHPDRNSDMAAVKGMDVRENDRTYQNVWSALHWISGFWSQFCPRTSGHSGSKVMLGQQLLMNLLFSGQLFMSRGQLHHL